MSADEIRKTARAWGELREWACHDADEGFNIKRRDEKGEPDYWVYLGCEGEWEEQRKFAREVAETFGIPLIEITWDEENEDVETVVYDPPDRVAELLRLGNALAEAAEKFKDVPYCADLQEPLGAWNKGT